MSDRWEQLKAIFEHAVALEGELRESYLRDACGDDDSLLVQVRALLDADVDDDSIFDGKRRPDLDGRAAMHETLSSAEAVASRPAETIGPYRLLEKLGEGGMGEVWLAEQLEPVRRKVAVKLIKPALASKRFVARFEAERQALALMDHPAIPKVYEAGTTLDGRPYFAMEYVVGLPITEHCDRYRLTNRRRLDLLAQVCDGVQHAHEKAVIHRDLKPSNVLVTMQGDRAVPKIIDFGVAKALSQKLTDKTIHTQLGWMIGTPAYMSPEQVDQKNQDVDTRTDVYALGVMLYELLVGALPIDPSELHEAGLEAMVRKIRQEEPPRPSTRLLTLGERSRESAECRQTDVPSWKRELSGDLDWITMKALEKDRARRYRSPHELAADIERYRTDQPVLARPPSAAYRAAKFVRRHRGGVAIAAIGLLALVVFAITLAVQVRRTADERDRANLEASTTNETLGILVDLFEVADPEGEAGVDITARELVERGVARVDRELDGKPEVQATLLHTLGVIYRRMGRYRESVGLLERAVPLRGESLGIEHARTIDSRRELAIAYFDFGDVPQAEALITAVIAQLESLHGPRSLEVSSALNTLGAILFTVHRDEEAAGVLERALAIRETELGRNHPSVAYTLQNMANAYANLGRLEEAERLLLRALAIDKVTYEPPNKNIASDLAELGVLYAELGRFPEAREHLQAAMEIDRALQGDTGADVAWDLRELCRLDLEMERFEQAERLCRESIEIFEPAVHDDHQFLYMARQLHARALTALGRYDEARLRWEQAREAAPRVYAEGGDREVWNIQLQIGRIELTRGKHRAAKEILCPLLTQTNVHVSEEQLDGLRGELTTHRVRCDP